MKKPTLASILIFPCPSSPLTCEPRSPEQLWPCEPPSPSASVIRRKHTFIRTRLSVKTQPCLPPTTWTTTWWIHHFHQNGRHGHAVSDMSHEWQKTVKTDIEREFSIAPVFLPKMEAQRIQGDVSLWSVPLCWVDTSQAANVAVVATFV